MLRSLAIVVFLHILAFTAAAHSEVTIEGDMGGVVAHYNQRYIEYTKSNTDVVIAGACMSACTRFVSLPHVCAEEKGFFYFHGLSVEGKVRPDEGLADSKRWETPAAVALQVKYGAPSFGFVKRKPTDPREIALEPGVWRVYTKAESVGPDTYQVWLKVQATKLVPACD